MLWLVEMPWVMANGAGVDYVLLAGSQEQVRQSMPSWINEPEGNCPPYNEHVRAYRVMIEEDCDALPFGIPATPNTARVVALIEEKMGEDDDRYVLLTRPGNIWGTTAKTLEELACYKRPNEPWLTLRLVEKYSWTFSDMLP